MLPRAPCPAANAEWGMPDLSSSGRSKTSGFFHQWRREPRPAHFQGTRRRHDGTFPPMHGPEIIDDPVVVNSPGRLEILATCFPLLPSRPTMGESLIQLAKERLDIPTLWRLRGWPREPGKECFRPYAPEDTRRSGSVFQEGRLFRDFKTGDTLDAPALLALVEGMSNSAACCIFIDLAGVARERSGSREPAKRTPPLSCSRPSPRTCRSHQTHLARPPRPGTPRPRRDR